MEKNCSNIRTALRRADEKMYVDKRLYYEQHPDQSDSLYPEFVFEASFKQSLHFFHRFHIFVDYVVHGAADRQIHICVISHAAQSFYSVIALCKLGIWRAEGDTFAISEIMAVW